jgi:hypothetical protein
MTSSNWYRDGLMPSDIQLAIILEPIDYGSRPNYPIENRNPWGLQYPTKSGISYRDGTIVMSMTNHLPMLTFTECYAGLKAALERAKQLKDCGWLDDAEIIIKYQDQVLSVDDTEEIIAIILREV